MKPLSIIILSILVLNFTCEEIEISPSTAEDVEYLKYGTSFGECLGYCIQYVTIEGGQALLTMKGWDMDGPLEDKNCSIQYFRDPLPDYLEKFDLEAFMDMDDVYGCPDCADGGAEFLELSIRGTVKLVTFEYGDAPAEISGVVESLRDLKETFGECETE